MTRHRLVVLALCAIGTLGLGPTTHQVSVSASRVLSGDTTVVTSLDEQMVVVSIDIAADGKKGDGVVDQAFRVQLAGAGEFSYSGPATVIFTGNTLTVGWNGQTVWAFSLIGKGTVQAIEAEEAVPAVGLARFWGSSIQDTHASVASLLLGTGGCGISAEAQVNSAVPCCGDGQDCAIMCNESDGCSASCPDGWRACCVCGGCRCCK
jgi:hypothetical protein